MFAVIYRTYVPSNVVQEYRKHWKTIAEYFVKARGALGSTLHQSEEGYFVAYSRWPDKATRDTSWPVHAKNRDEFPETVIQASEWLEEHIEEKHRLPEICMEITEEIS